MNRRSITLAVVVVLCAAWFAYSQGWFDRSKPDIETPSNTVSANEAVDQDNTKANAEPVTQGTQQPIDSAK